MTDKSVLIIAEAGVNHNGSLDRALRLVEAAAQAGADIVKFQTFRADLLASRHATKAAYQIRSTGTDESQRDMLHRLELDEAAHERLIAHCAACGIRFLSSPFDPDSLELLTTRFCLPLLKLGSGELTNAPLLLAAAHSDRPLILSTGMSTLGEVEQALGVVAFGYTRPACARPSRTAFEAAWADPAARAVLAERVTLLHCTTEYPAPIGDVNLRAMDTLRAAFGLCVGYSDHTVGITIPIAAAARGAAVIEKHFTLDRSLPGPDHAASLEPSELAAMVDAVRQVEAALGDGMKTARGTERQNLAVARKSVVAARDIPPGAVLGPEDLTVKRPGSGRTPLDYWDLLGTAATRAYHAEEPLE